MYMCLCMYMYIYRGEWSFPNPQLSIFGIVPNTIQCGGCTDPSHAPYREVWYKPIYFNTHDRNTVHTRSRIYNIQYLEHV